jgi:hypothetical protein
MDKVKPALLGGAITGVLSVIPFVNTCCCIWAALGGLLATFMYIRSAPAPVSTGDGAMVGAITGVFGAIIYLIIGIPLGLLLGTGAQFEEAIRRSGAQVPLTGVALILIGSLVVAILLLVSAIVGGLIAVPIFEKRKGQTAPPPPPAPGAPGGYGTGM